MMYDPLGHSEWRAMQTAQQYQRWVNHTEEETRRPHPQSDIEQAQTWSEKQERQPVVRAIIPLLLFLASACPDVGARAETVTAYCPCARCCGKANQPAANGKLPVQGKTCAGPRSVPLGTRVHIQGVGVRVVTDRTARRYDGRYDLFFASHQDAVQFGKRQLQVVAVRQRNELTSTGQTRRITQ